MKKLLFVILSVIACTCFAVGFVGCGGDEHVHTYSTEWTFDATYHWHAATCEHKDEVSDKAEHTLVNGKCSVCGYEKGKVDPDPAPQREKGFIEKIVDGFLNSAYTLDVTVDLGEGEVHKIVNVTSLKDLYNKVKVDELVGLFDASGLYVKNIETIDTEDNMSAVYASVKAFIGELFFELSDGMTLDELINNINAYLPEGWTVDDLIEIVYKDGAFGFDAAKLKSFIETFFNEGVTLEDVIAKVSDGLTYEDMVAIFPETTIAAINGMLPQGYTLETVMPFISNITPARLSAIVGALANGTLSVEVIDAILPEGFSITMANKFLPEDMQVGYILETVNSIIKELNKIDFEAIAEEQIKISNEFKAKVAKFIVDNCFIKEEVANGVKYTVNYAAIKNLNEFLYTSTLEEVINAVYGENFVQNTADFIVAFMDYKLSTVKTMAEEFLGFTFEDALNAIDTYADKYAPFIENVILMAGGDEVEILDNIKMATSTVRQYLADEVFMNKTVAQTIAEYTKNETEESIKEQLQGAINRVLPVLRANTVYTLMSNTPIFYRLAYFMPTYDPAYDYKPAEAAEMVYRFINSVADNLTENYPIYVILNAAGEIEELSIEAVIPGGHLSIALNKGDLLGEVLTAEEKAELASYPAKKTLADFNGYEYDSEYGKVTVTVDKDDNIITKTRVDDDGYTNIKTMRILDIDWTDNVVMIGKNGEVGFVVDAYYSWTSWVENDYDDDEYDNDHEYYEYPSAIMIVFGENSAWLDEDSEYMDPNYEEPDYNNGANAKEVIPGDVILEVA